MTAVNPLWSPSLALAEMEVGENEKHCREESTALEFQGQIQGQGRASTPGSERRMCFRKMLVVPFVTLNSFSVEGDLQGI